jgi:TrmH family RNA methyltransferase
MLGAQIIPVRTGIASNLQKTVRDLQRRKARGRRGLAVLEGVRLVEEALAAGLEFRGALVSPDLARTTRGQALTAELASHAVEIEEVGARSFGQLAGTDTPQGILAIVQPKVWTLADVARVGGPLLVVDGVQDPGNVGTLIRTAHALGASASLLLRGTADPMNPKALRAAMGATFRHPVVQLDDPPFIAWARERGITLWASAADGTPLPRALEARPSNKDLIAVIVGNEGAGIRPQLNAVAAQRVAIPLAGGAESLNVAVAAGILLYEVSRGR